MLSRSVHYSSELMCWVAASPSGGEVYGETRRECEERLAEAYRIMSQHTAIEAGQLELVALELCNCVTLDMPGHDQTCPACSPDDYAGEELPY